jgi:predicted lipid-binding transport protein (Tim44 family)
MLRALVFTGLLAVAPVAVLSTAPAAAQSANPQKCQDTPEKQAKRSMFGGILGSIGGGLLGHAGAAGSVVAASLPAASYLGDQLLKILDCKEQQQAAKATDQAIQGGVGTEVSWKSDSRPNVTGTSKVTGQEAMADGGQCLTVTDVVIVDGEETTVPKKMCRAKGASGYVKA